MAQASEFIARRLTPALGAERPDLFSELGEFFRFLREELQPFPGRGQAVARFVICAVLANIISQTLRVPEPDFSAYLVFFIANEDGVSSIKLGVLAMLGVTISLAAAAWVSICFMDAPWFRVPVTILIIGGAIWLSRTMVLAVMGRLIAVILALYLSLADTIFDPEQLTESTLWLWSVVGVAVGVSALVSVLIDPRPDLLLRAQIESELETVENALAALAWGRADRLALPRALRRSVYAAPQRMRQLLARWQQRAWPSGYAEADWALAILVTQRLLSVTAALTALERPSEDERIRSAFADFAGTVGELKRAAHEQDREAIRLLAVPELDSLPAGEEKTALVELAAALADCRLLTTPVAGDAAPAAPHAAPKLWALVPDARTNPAYLRFTVKTMLAIFACEIFMNAVAWPGIRTCLITCAVTALATVGAQRQKQLLRLAGVCVGGLMGLGAVVFIVPHLERITGLSLLVAAGAACCAWVAAGSVRSSYAGYQMALAFFLMVLPGFATSIDLTGIRDRFVGVLVGITAMWIFVDHLWHTSSRRQLLEKLTAILRRMARATEVVSPALEPAEARRRAADFRRDVINDLNQGRLLLDETKIELTLALEPPQVRGSDLEVAARDVSFAGFALLGLNEKKLRLLAEARLVALEPALRPADEALARNFTALAGAFEPAQETAPRIDLAPQPLPEEDGSGYELRSIYDMLDHTVRRLADLQPVVQRLA